MFFKITEKKGMQQHGRIFTFSLLRIFMRNDGHCDKDDFMFHFKLYLESLKELIKEDPLLEQLHQIWLLNVKYIFDNISMTLSL